MRTVFRLIGGSWVQYRNGPLIPLFSTKLVEELPVRVQHFRLHMVRFDSDITYVPGKNLVIVDALSRAPQMPLDQNDEQLEDKIQAYVT